MKYKWFYTYKKSLEETESVFVDDTAISITDDSSILECKTVNVKWFSMGELLSH
jgi:hypothetical protein